MTTQIIFKTDSDLKNAFINKVKHDWISLKAFLTYCIRAYLQWKIQLWIQATWEQEVEDVEVNTKIQNKMDKIANLF